ncbi:MAG: DUF3187 family protein [Candidatus Omnitrophica bacterium]|nr:DUF3187 family protein [Candidatus Omnitrophota bacterium]
MDMRKTTIVFLFLIFMGLTCVSGRAFAYDEDEDSYPYMRSGGPIPVRNQMPLYLFYLQMAPDRASVVKKGEFLTNADYTVSNITVSAFTPATSFYDVQIDLEVQRLTLDLRYGLYDNLEIGLEIPYIGMCSGYMDNFIEGFEDGIAARTPRSRERQGSYEFDYSLRYNGTYLIREKTSKKGLGEIMFNAKYQLLREEWYGIWPNVSLRSSVKFPTSDKKDLIGSDEFDYGFGILMDKCFFDRFFIYLGGSAVFIEKPGVLSALDIGDKIYSYMLTLEYLLTENFSLVTQVSGNTTPYPESDTNPLDNDAHEWALGFNYKLKEKSDVSWSFAVVENISAASSPDVSFNTGLNWEF